MRGLGEFYLGAPTWVWLGLWMGVALGLWL